MGGPDNSQPQTFWGKAKKFAVKQFLPIGFAVAVIWALSWPEPGAAANALERNHFKIVSMINMIIIFLIFGLTLETSEMFQAVKAWKAMLLGLSSILFVTALTGFISVRIPFKPREFGLGITIMACVPTSLSSGVTLVIMSYGNGALALLFTVGSNILGIFLAPIMVKAVLGSQTNAQVDTNALLLKLSIAILLPLVVGKILRDFLPPVQKFAKTYKTPLYLVNNFQIIMIVWQTLSSSQKVLVQQEAYDIILCVVASLMQHFVFLIMNTFFTWILRLPERERKAVIVMASQKALPIAATIIAYLDESVGNLGLMTVPCIVFYVGQLFIDAYITNGWASKYEKAGSYEQKYKDALQELEEEEKAGLIGNAQEPVADAGQAADSDGFEDVHLATNMLTKARY